MSGRVTGNRSLRKVEPPAIRTEEQIEAEQYGAWQVWLKDLTPDERIAIENAGLEAPKPPRKPRRVRRDHPEDEDVLDGNCEHLGHTTLHPLDPVDPFEALARKEEAAEAAKAEYADKGAMEIDEPTRRELVLLGYVLPAIIDAANPRLEASVLALALDIGLRQGITPQGLGEQHGMAVQAVLARVRKWQVGLGVCRASLGLLRVVISPILASRNPRLEAQSIALAARFGLEEGVSMTRLGERHGVCKAAISARVRRWVERFGLPLPRGCKEETDNYLLFNKRKTKSPTIE